MTATRIFIPEGMPGWSPIRSFADHAGDVLAVEHPATPGLDAGAVVTLATPPMGVDLDAAAVRVLIADLEAVLREEAGTE